ncbi:hypothetical protein PILCRDRAFT_196375 [Piloderma croceum F 1598]|uniref:Extracellular membrane protein CFEM domain-containing protein n=1 Tax=Piloderma croceum (strain F 1598) TaxID=765440 RepID=A0A0C3CJ87_PILCF|nr:hypothetical protein PILCRDRAFT_196375 [Piloderma croceum F 1598]
MSLHRNHMLALVFVLGLNVLRDIHALPSAVPDVDHAYSGADATLAEKCDSVCDSIHQVDPMPTCRDFSCICADHSTQSPVACFQCNLEATNASLDPELRALMESVLTEYNYVCKDGDAPRDLDGSFANTDPNVLRDPQQLHGLLTKSQTPESPLPLLPLPHSSSSPQLRGILPMLWWMIRISGSREVRE